MPCVRCACDFILWNVPGERDWLRMDIVLGDAYD